MDIQVKNCDKTRVIKGTPLNHILSTPIWLSCRQIGYERCKESWMRRRCPALSLQKRFAKSKSISTRISFYHFTLITSIIYTKYWVIKRECTKSAMKTTNGMTYFKYILNKGLCFT